MIDLLITDTVISGDERRMDVGISSGKIAFVTPCGERKTEASRVVQGKGAYCYPDSSSRIFIWKKHICWIPWIGRRSLSRTRFR